jgi:hypothetical protein
MGNILLPVLVLCIRSDNSHWEKPAKWQAATTSRVWPIAFTCCNQHSREIIPHHLATTSLSLNGVLCTSHMHLKEPLMLRSLGWWANSLLSDNSNSWTAWVKAQKKSYRMSNQIECGQNNSQSLSTTLKKLHIFWKEYLSKQRNFLATIDGCINA